MRLSSSPIIAANSPSDTPSGGHKSVGPRAAPETDSLTAIEQNAFGKLAHRIPELLNTDWRSLSTNNFPVYVAQIRTIYMFSISSIISREDDCTPFLDIYPAPLMSTLPTTGVYDGRSLDPGGGCVMSSTGDKKMDQCGRVPRSERSTHNYSRVYGIVQI